MPFTPPAGYPYDDDSAPGANDGDIVFAEHVNSIMEYLEDVLPTDILNAGSISLTNDTPANLGTAAVGNGTTAARSNHVHQMPTAAQVGAATQADIDDAIDAHVADTDPHGDRAYADALFASLDTTDFQGLINCSTNPNYPAADADHAYRVSAAGKIGGASGVDVEVGDLCICQANGTPSGTQAAVGANWTIVQGNLNGVVIGPTSSVDGRIAVFDGTTGSVIRQGTQTVDELNRPRVIQFLVTDPSAADVGVGDGQAFALIPTELNGKSIIEVSAAVTTVSSSGAVTVQIARVRSGTAVDVLSTRVTIDASEATSYTAATPPVINTSNDDLATGDLLRVDVDTAGTGTKGLIVSVTVD